MQHRVHVSIATAAIVLAACPLAVVAALPGLSLPPGFVSKDDPRGGRVIYGPIKPAGFTFTSGLRITNRMFNGTLELDSVVQGTQGVAPATMAWFHAVLGGTRVAGLALTAVDPEGGPRLTVLFDREDAIAMSLPRLYEDMTAAAKGPADGAAPHARPAPVSPLHAVAARDNSISLKIPDGWTIERMEHGLYAVNGSDGARVESTFVSLASPGNRYLPFLHVAYVADPAAAFDAVHRANAIWLHAPDPNVKIEDSKPVPPPSNAVPGTMGSILVGTINTPKGKRRFAGFVSTTPPTQPNGPWLMSLMNLVSAPVDRFAIDFPTMVAIGRTVAINGRVVAAQDQRIEAGIAAATQNMLENAAAGQARQRGMFERSMASARQAQDSIDRSTAGFVHYLSDQSVVNQASTNGHGTVGNSLAQTLVNAHPNEYSIVPLNRYRKGVDY